MNSVQQLMDGAALLRDWLGDGGKTVRPHIADVRASICLECPRHRHGKWWEKMLKDPIAEVIRKQLAIRQRMKVESTFDDLLFMCRTCGCCLRLKVFVPTEHLKSHTPPEKLKEYPPDCWIRSELEAEL